MSSIGGMCSEAFQWEFAAPSASEGRPFAVGDRMGQRARRASARRERDLAQVHDPSLEESAVAYLAAGVQTTAGGSTQGWIWWRDFMRSLGESPEQHGELADGPEVRLRIEGYYLRFVVWLVHVRGVQVETARKYFAEALSAHVTYYGPPVPGYNMPRVRKMIKGMAKVIDASPRRPRRAVRTQDLKAALDELPLDSVSAVNARACASVGFCGLLRAAEMSLQRGQVWSKARCLNRADVTFLARSVVGGRAAHRVDLVR
jgi:hypothetical protein